MAQKCRLACIFLASGHSKRFDGNKLTANFRGRPLIDVVLGNFPAEYFNQTVVVTRCAPVAVTAAGLGFAVAENDDETDDIAKTIRLGLDALVPGMDGCMFSVCDQPLLRAESIARLIGAFCAEPESIAALGFEGKRGNPVIFPKRLFGELVSLTRGQSGSAVIKAHQALLRIVEVDDPRELSDVDTREDLRRLSV